MSEVGYGIYEGDWYEGMIFHTRFYGGENTKVLFVHCTHYCWIELHDCIYLVVVVGGVPLCCMVPSKTLSRYLLVIFFAIQNKMGGGESIHVEDF